MRPPSSLLGRLREVVVNIGPLGFLAFGGPGVNIILFHRLFVQSSHPWLDAVTFADLFSLSGALPGPGSTQLLFSIALVRGGALAGLLAFFLWALPGAVGMFLLSIGVTHFPSTLPSIVLALLTGLNASAVGLIAFAGYQLTLATAKDPLTRLVLFGTASIGSCYSAVWLFPVLTFAGGLVTVVGDWEGWGRLGERIKGVGKAKANQGEVGAGTAREDISGEVNGREDDEIALEELRTGDTVGASICRTSSRGIKEITRLPTPPPEPATSDPITLRHRTNAIPPVSSPRVTPREEDASLPRTPINFHLRIIYSLLYLAAFFAVLITTLVLRSNLPNPSRALELFGVMLTAGTILFGGGPVVIPLLQGYTVAPGWVSTQDFLFGFAILQAFPGPNFNFAVFLGALSLPDNPVLGAVLGFIGLFGPGIVLKFALLPTYSKFREHKLVRSALRGLNSAASGLVWTAVYRLWTVGLLTGGTQTASLEASGYWLSVAGGAYAASVWASVPPPVVIVGGVIAGLLYGAVKGAP